MATVSSVSSRLYALMLVFFCFEAKYRDPNIEIVFTLGPIKFVNITHIGLCESRFCGQKRPNSKTYAPFGIMIYVFRQAGVFLASSCGF